MQAPPGSLKRQQRVSTPDSSDVMSSQATPSSTTAANSSRVSSGSAKSSSRRKDPATQLSQIEKSVTHLLVATKQLLETLTQWSRGQATEGEVSDVYVRLGYEFNIACRAFTNIGVSVDDLGPVPDLLRAILEETLSQEASPQSLDRFLPKIRDIIINLLQGLKRKQSRLRAARNKEAGAAGSDAVRSQAPSSTEGDMDGADRGSEVAPPQRGSFKSVEPRTAGARVPLEDPGIPQRTSSVPGPAPASEEPPPFIPEPQNRASLKERRLTSSMDAGDNTSNQTQTLPIVQAEDYSGPIQRISLHEETPPPPPPPKQQDALMQLQRGGELERRASRRYSTYQISKHLGASPGGVPMLPPPQNTPIPNRGRDVRESLNAVRTRSSLVPQRRSQTLKDTSLARHTMIPASTERVDDKAPLPVATTNELPASRATETQQSTSVGKPADDSPALSGTVSGPLADAFPYEASPVSAQTSTTETRTGGTSTPKQAPQTLTEQLPAEFVPEDSPQPGKELTLFLQYKSRIKKIVLPDGANDLSMARLQLAFIEKFAWNTHNNGVDLPQIYIQDTVSGVRHELEDLSDIKDRAVLVLNIEPLDEIKRHMDDNFGNICKLVEGVKTTLEGQQVAISQVSNRQSDSAKDLARLMAAPPTVRNNSFPTNGALRSPVVTDSAMREIQTLRRDLAIMRQKITSFSTGVHTSMAAIKTKANAVKAKALDVAVPTFDANSGRAYVNSGKKSLGDDSDTLVNRVDDLQDVVEDLRKDVVTRGVRPLPRQLEAANKDISDATKELKKMQEYVKREKPTWTKIWEKELELVCNDREFLTMQEDLIADLEDDLEKATQTMKLVEQATHQQNLQASPGSSNTLRSTGRSVPNIDTDVDPQKAKDGVLGQVRALQPNSESRVEAIERAEKARQRELEDRGRDAAFKKELNSFVEEGKLKNSGGVEEVDRLRRAKDERNLKEEFDDQQKRKAERAKARAEERARLAAAAQTASPKEEEPEQDDGKSADDEMHDAEDGLPPTSESVSEQPPDAVSPSGRKSWLPAFMSGSN